jgi:hypothetical protein
MIVLLGEFTTGKAPASGYLARHGWGRMWVTKGPHFEYEGEPFGVDNGAFSAWRKGTRWDEAKFLRRVDAALTTGQTPVLSITPDIVAGGLRSLDFSVSWRSRLPDDLRWYLAVQDGMMPADVEPVAGLFSGVFLGGTDAFKRSVRVWRAWTNERGLPLHWGRVGTGRRLREAFDVGVDSIDSTTPVLKIGEGRKHLMDRFEAVFVGRDPQRELPFADRKVGTR